MKVDEYVSLGKLIRRLINIEILLEDKTRGTNADEYQRLSRESQAIVEELNARGDR